MSAHFTIGGGGVAGQEEQEQARGVAGQRQQGAGSNRFHCGLPACSALTCGPNANELCTLVTTFRMLVPTISDYFLPFWIRHGTQQGLKGCIIKGKQIRDGKVFAQAPIKAAAPNSHVLFVEQIWKNNCKGIAIRHNYIYLSISLSLCKKQTV